MKTADNLHKDLSKKIDLLIKTYLEVSVLRPEVLFRHFLPTGYRCTTLNLVPIDYIDQVIYAKMYLGMIITLYDDFADHPEHKNSKLLSQLYRLNIDQDCDSEVDLNPQEKKTFKLAKLLFSQMKNVLCTLNNYEMLMPVLRFDVEQFYLCNRHSELMTTIPSVRNLTESKRLGSYNMGIVAAGTIDLMASPSYVIEELGQYREIFLLGQRLGRISNLLYTFNRELVEGDSTNEISIAQTIVKNSSNSAPYNAKLRQEFRKKMLKIRSYDIQNFSSKQYAKGLLTLHNLHSSLEGKI